MLWWLATLALAAVTFAAVDGAAARASARQRAWGETISVPVVQRTVLAGAMVGDGDVERRRLPRALVPRGEVAGDPVGHAARVTLVPGEVVMASRLAPSGLGGVAALLGPDTRGVAVPRGDSAPPVEVGDRVDVLATFDIAPDEPPPPPEGEPGGPDPGGEPRGVPAPTFAVATRALVVHVGDQSITVAVAPEAAARVAFAVARGTVTLALAGA